MTVRRVRWSRAFFSVLVAILGTTISPYLFFWQAAQEVEEERALGRNLAQRRGATREELAACRTDVTTGMFASNAIMYFIIMTTARRCTRMARRPSPLRPRPPTRCARWLAPAHTGCLRWA